MLGLVWADLTGSGRTQNPGGGPTVRAGASPGLQGAGDHRTDPGHLAWFGREQYPQRNGVTGWDGGSVMRCERAGWRVFPVAAQCECDRPAGAGRIPARIQNHGRGVRISLAHHCGRSGPRAVVGAKVPGGSDVASVLGVGERVVVGARVRVPVVGFAVVDGGLVVTVAVVVLKVKVEVDGVVVAVAGVVEVLGLVGSVGASEVSLAAK